MQTSAHDLIRRALVKMNSLAPTENPDGQQAADALWDLNLMLGSWAKMELMLQGFITVDLPLEAGKGSYTWGPGGDLDTARPPAGIDSVFLIDSSTPGQALTLPMKVLTDNQFEALQLKEVESEYPMYLRYNKTWPQAQVDVWPVPNTNHSLRFRRQGAIDSFPTLTSIADLDEGYIRAIEWNLAVELSASYGEEPSAVMQLRASSTIAQIKMNNTNTELMAMDPMLLAGNRHRFNILTGE